MTACQCQLHRELTVGQLLKNGQCGLRFVGRHQQAGKRERLGRTKPHFAQMLLQNRPFPLLSQRNFGKCDRQTLTGMGGVGSGAQMFQFFDDGRNGVRPILRQSQFHQCQRSLTPGGKSA